MKEQTRVGDCKHVAALAVMVKQRDGKQKINVSNVNIFHCVSALQTVLRGAMPHTDHAIFNAGKVHVTREGRKHI